jgi:hypothetical protein
MHIWKNELGLGVRGVGRARHEASHYLYFLCARFGIM